MPDATIDQIPLATVHLPDWHPRAAEGVVLVFGFVIRHPDGVILVDTGVGSDNAFINDQYRPDVVPLATALGRVGVDERDVGAIVNTHLHFDHCGQNQALPRVPVWVADAEVEAATQQFYTVPEWAVIDAHRRRSARDGEEIAEGVRVLATPGHTPGHQSVTVDGIDGGVDLIVGQCCYCQSEFDAGPPPAEALHDLADMDTASQSLDRLRALAPQRTYFSHEAVG